MNENVDSGPPDACRIHRPHLVVDDRECRGALLAALAACDAFDIEVRRLPVGDYRVDDALLFERKTLIDLVVSIKDGRLFHQALRLANAELPAALILEGGARDLVSSGMRAEAIRGALLNVSLFIGLPVLRTRNVEETLRTLLYAARQRRVIAGGALPRRGRRPRGKAALQSYVLQGLPCIGPFRAARLIQRFGSIEAAITADANALTEVDGIGSAIARRLRWTVEESRACYATRDDVRRRMGIASVHLSAVPGRH
jgi:ERCC4-type nuclease